MTRLYVDIYGDVWELILEGTVRRLRDGNLGGFFNGKGLIPTSKRS